jgi:hypothetical protein
VAFDAHHQQHSHDDPVINSDSCSSIFQTTSTSIWTSISSYQDHVHDHAHEHVHEYVHKEARSDPDLYHAYFALAYLHLAI